MCWNFSCLLSKLSQIKDLGHVLKAKYSGNLGVLEYCNGFRAIHFACATMLTLEGRLRNAGPVIAISSIVYVPHPEKF